MGWEFRRSKRVYYRKTRSGGRVLSTYLPGTPGRFEAIEVERRQRARDADRRDREAWSRVEASFRQWFVQVDQAVTQAIEEAGFHRHDRGQWRRRRMSTERPGIPDEITQQSGVITAACGGDVAALAEKLWLRASFTAAPEFRAGVAAKMARMRAELAGPGASPLEKLLAERVAMCWLQLSIIDACAGSQAGFKGDQFGKRAERAQRMYLRAIKALTELRRLPIAAAVQVNIHNTVTSHSPAAIAHSQVAEDLVRQVR